MGRKLFLVPVAFLLVVVFVRAEEPRRVAADRPVDILHIKLDLKVDVPKKTVGGTATIDLVALRDLASIRLDAVDFDVSRVTLALGEARAAPVEYVNDGEAIEVLFGDTPLSAGSPATLTIHYAIANPRSGLHFFGPTEAEPDTPYVVWSQGESITNRYWIPCLDHPNEMQTTEMIITTAAENEVISNGRLLSRKKNPDDTVTFHWLQDKPHVAYLISLVVGEFHVERETWRDKPVTFYVPHKNRDDVKRTFGNTIRMLEHFSRITGVEYPWDKYAQTCAEGFGGGMENTSATTLGTWVLHDERAHIDYSGDSLIAHELAHQWFGDLVTCKDWSHLWLNEGFASFMSPVWFEYDLGKDEYDYAIYRAMKRAIRGGKDRPVVDRHYDAARDMFDSRAYPKGASILHMLRRRVGDAMFWRSVKHYLTEHAHQTVETSDFRKAFEQVTGRSLERFFYDWTERPGAPSLDVRYEWIEEDRLAKIIVKQTQEEEAFHFPFEIEFHLDDTERTEFRRVITEKEARFFFPLPKNPTMVLIDPHDAVLKEIKEHKGRDLWAAQLTNAPYATTRIRAAGHFGESGGDADVELLHEALQREKFWGVGVEIAEALADAGGDEARDALLSGLQLEHPKVRRACAAELGSFHRDEKVISALSGLIQRGDPSYRVEAAAIKSYGKLQPEGALPFLTSLLDRDSHREQIRSAALIAIGEQKDSTGLDVLLTWARRGKPRFCRIAAMNALGILAENVDLEDEEMHRVVETVVASTKGEPRRVQQVALRTLGGMGKGARPALPALRAVAANDPLSRIRKAAKEAIEKITASAPPQVQIGDLREELDKLKDENEDLKKRLEKLENLREQSSGEDKG